MKLKVNSDHTLSTAIGALRKEYKEHRYLSINITTGKARTLPLNSLSHAWYSQVSKEEGEFTEGEIKCLCKYHKGLPILRGEDEEFNELCVKVIDPLPYEHKIAAMEYMPVTSLMNTKQFVRYLEAVQQNYVGRVDLQFPEKDIEAAKV